MNKAKDIQSVLDIIFDYTQDVVNKSAWTDEPWTEYDDTMFEYMWYFVKAKECRNEQD